MSRAAPVSVPKLSGLPVVAVIGRPNVGKSTLFNRLVGARKAIVDDFPGVTRDRNYAQAQWAGTSYLLVDTGGIESASGGKLEESVHAQSRIALAEADAVIFLLDGKAGLSPLDREVVNSLRKSPKPVFFAVNKIDSRRRGDNLFEFYSLGLEPLYSISAEHGLGITELLDDVVRRLPRTGQSEEAVGDGLELVDTAHAVREPARVAVVGRPNVGKSTLINRLLGFDRSVVDAAPGTTRDALETPFVLQGEPAVLVDTAGIRRKARIDDRVERFSVSRSLRAVDDGDLIIHVIDGVENVTDQDAQILSYACERGKAVLLAVNKWDLLEASGADAESYREEVYFRLKFLVHAPVCFISAATGYGLRRMQETAALVLQSYRRKISTSQVNQALQRIVKAHSAPLYQGRAVKFYYGTQTGSRPPAFTLFV
ncbi:MAG TPA: ribosome biogenesis GTPase Der, partial [Candidatus Binatia bacterium]|nr:ribosome biogenesis GTPase Der [Candidatus Binatia bacterium]